MDFARFFAMLSVVALHTTDQLMITHPNISDLKFGLYQAFRIIGRCGVPIFLMISGALILPKINQMSVAGFYKKRLPQFFLVLAFYFFITNIFVITLNKGEIKYDDLFNDLIHGRMMHAYQLWFMFTIIGIYFVAPFVGRMLQALKNSEILIYLSLCIIVYFLSVSQNILAGSGSVYTVFGGDFLGTYLAYFIIGYLIHERKIIKNVKAITITLLLALAISTVVYIQFYLKSQGVLNTNEGFTWYNSMGILIVSILIFSLMSKIKCSHHGGTSKLLKFLSDSSFCVYLFHLIPLEYLLTSSQLKAQPVILSAAFITIMVYAACTIYYLILYKIKYLRKLVI